MSIHKMKGTETECDKVLFFVRAEVSVFVQEALWPKDFRVAPRGGLHVDG